MAGIAGLRCVTHQRVAVFSVAATSIALHAGYDENPPAPSVILFRLLLLNLDCFDSHHDCALIIKAEPLGGSRAEVDDSVT